MTYTKSTVQDFVATVPPFDQLSPTALSYATERFQLLRYRMGQAVLVRDRLPNQVCIVYQGQVRLLGYDPRTQKPVTLQLLQPGAMFGWVGLVRGVACETVIASTETICLTLSAADFLAMLEREPVLAKAFRQRAPLMEVFELMGAELHRQANGDADLKELSLQAEAEAVVCNLPPGRTPITQLEPDRIWLVSGGGEIANFPVGSRLTLNGRLTSVEVVGNQPARVIGFPESLTQQQIEDVSSTEPTGIAAIEPEIEIPYAPDRPTEADPSLTDTKNPSARRNYPYVRGKGELDEAMACMQMLCQYFNMPFRNDVVKRVLTGQAQRMGGVSLELCGAVAEMMGLNAQLVLVPASAIGRLEGPALLKWQDGIVVLYEASERELVIADPQSGVRHRKPAEFAETWGQQGEVLLLKSTKQTPQQRFGLSWFLPAIQKHKRVLIEVFIASFFVQLFALANPLMIQVIIDKVIVQKSIDTLHVLGVLLLALAVLRPC